MYRLDFGDMEYRTLLPRRWQQSADKHQCMLVHRKEKNAFRYDTPFCRRLQQSPHDSPATEQRKKKHSPLSPFHPHERPVSFQAHHPMTENHSISLPFPNLPAHCPKFFSQLHARCVGEKLASSILTRKKKKGHHSFPWDILVGKDGGGFFWYW